MSILGLGLDDAERDADELELEELDEELELDELELDELEEDDELEDAGDVASIPFTLGAHADKNTAPALEPRTSKAVRRSNREDMSRVLLIGSVGQIGICLSLGLHCPFARHSAQVPVIISNTRRTGV